jgi:hypothetical protein
MSEITIITARSAKVTVPYRKGTRKGNNGEFEFEEIYFTVAIKMPDGSTKWVPVKATGHNAQIINEWATAPSKKEGAKDNDVQSRFMKLVGFYQKYKGERLIDFQLPYNGKTLNIKGFKIEEEKEQFVVYNFNGAVEFLDSNPNPKQDKGIEQTNLTVEVEDGADIQDGATIDFTAQPASAPAQDQNGMPCLF